MHPSHTLLTLLSVSSTVLAAPVPSTTAIDMDHSRLEDLQCQCLSISSDPLAKPTICSALESHKLNWYTASSLAADHDLAIEYASKFTIERIVDTERVLPQNMLDSIQEEAVFKGERPQGLVQMRNVLVCGFGEEMKGLGGFGDQEEVGAPEYHCVGYLGAGIMIVAVVYMLVEHVWSRFFAQGAIKLEGEEKTLTAEADAEETQDEPCEEKSEPAAFS